MALCRIYYKPDGTVAVVHPVLKTRKPSETIWEHLARTAEKAARETELEGLPFEDVDQSTLPDRKDRGKWRGAKGQGVRVDPSIVTPGERRAALEAQLDAELNKPSPDPVKALKIQRNLEKRKF